MAKTVCIAPMQKGQTLVEMVEALNKKHKKTFGRFVKVYAMDRFMTAEDLEIDGNLTIGQRIDDTMGHFSNRILRVAEQRGMVIYHSNDEAVKKELKVELKARLGERGYQVEEIYY